MSVVTDGVLTQMSVSQAETFARCGLRWWFERAHDLRPDQNAAQSDGESGHALLAHWLRTGELPKGRVRMKKHVTAAILKGLLPTSGPDLLVEERFDGQAQRDATGKWIPLDVANTFHLGGLPWEGFIDLAYRRGPVPVILDHKFSSDPRAYAKKPEELIQTIQMPVYVLSQLPYWPDAQEWCIAHHYVAKTGIDSFLRTATVHVDQVYKRREEIEGQVGQMRALAGVTEQKEVPYSLSACLDYGGCPHQSICQRYRQQGAQHVELTPEEIAMLEGLDLPAPAPAPAPAAPQPPSRAAPSPAPAASAQAAPQAALVAAPAKKALFHVDAADPTVVPPPTEAPAPAPSAASACDRCGAAINAENGSCLRDGTWVHVGCPSDAPSPAAATTPAPRVRRPKAAPVAAPQTLPDPPPTAPEAPPKPAPVPAPLPIAAPVTVVDASFLGPGIRTFSTYPGANPETLATLFESIAKLLRG